MAVPWTVVDAITVLLAALGVTLTAVAIGVGVLAFWGYRDIKRASVKAAETEAKRIAENVAARQIQAFLDKQPDGHDISVAYREEPK